MAGAVSQRLKGPHRYGPLRAAFRRRFVLVCGTPGTPEENAASHDAARFSAETFRHPGSGNAAVRYAARLPVFLSGVGFPDALILGTDTLVRGTGGIRPAGFFGEDWGLVPEDTARADSVPLPHHRRIPTGTG